MANVFNKDQHILFVDDETEIARMLVDHFDRAGITALSANSVDAGFELVKRHQESLICIVSDLSMPEKDGLEFRTMLLDDHKDIPFILLSAHITKELALKGIELQIAGFLDKPYPYDDLVNVVAEKAADRIEAIEEEKELLAGFIADAEDLIEELEPLILGLEDDPNNFDAINNMFRIIHTIKGASGFFEPDYVHRFAHKFEDFLSKIKNGLLQVDAQIASIMLKSFDTMKELISKLERGDKDAFDVDAAAEIYNLDDQVRQSGGQIKEGDASAAKKEAAGAKEDLKVPIQLLDEFMTLSGEITVYRNMIDKLVKAIEKENKGNKDVILLNELLDEMHKINSQMQSKLSDVRKVKVASIYRPLKRIIRDLSLSLGKNIDLNMQGEELRVDTVLAEVLSNSLVHMVRNCADHGLESTEDRKQAGKPEEGHIQLKAYEENEVVFVEIIDDGRGLDPEKIAAKVREKELVTEDELGQMSESKILQMIFAPGFSTAAQITDVSGRGVGMDMVLSSVKKIGGRVDIDSEIGRGTKFTLELPVPKSVLIISSLQVRVGKEILTIPQDNIVRVLKLDGNNEKRIVETLEGGNVIHYHGGLVPVVEIDNLFAINESIRAESDFRGANTNETRNSAEKSYVILKGKRHQFAIQVDEVLDIEDTVVKPLGRHLHSIHAFSGATFLGDGSIGLIIDVDGIGTMADVSEIDEEENRNKAQEELELKKVNTKQQPNEYVLVDIKQRSPYAIQRNEVFRLEQIPQSNLQYSGKHAVIPYRGKTMPLYDLRETLRLKDHSGKNTNSNEEAKILVTSSENNFIGYIVDEILDIAVSNKELNREIRDREEITGNISINDKNIPVVSLEELNQKTIKFRKAG